MLVALSRSAVRAGLAVGGAGRCRGARRRRRPATGTWASRMARNRCVWTRGESCGPDDLARRCSQVAEGAAAASERDQPTGYQRRPHTDHRSDRSASAAGQDQGADGEQCVARERAPGDLAGQQGVVPTRSWPLGRRAVLPHSRLLLRRLCRPGRVNGGAGEEVTRSRGPPAAACGRRRRSSSSLRP